MGKPKKIKSGDNSPKPAKEMKKNPEEKNVEKKKNSEEKKRKTTKKELNEKGESSDVVHKVEKTEESNPKKNSSGILSVTNIKTKGKAKFSLAELEGEDSSIGLGYCQW